MVIIALGLAPAHSQFGPRGVPPAGPRLGGATDKSSGDTMTVPGKITFDSGKSRFEVDMTRAGGGKMRPEQAEQMKSMGMPPMGH